MAETAMRRSEWRVCLFALTLPYGIISSSGSSIDLSGESACCGPPGLVCGGANFSGIVEETLYFAHPRSAGGSFDWGNHDMADALGEAAFLCVDGSFVTRFNDSLISTVRMRWNASYVNYAECDDVEGGQCIFGDGIGVGVGRINPFYWPGKGNACGFPDGTSITGQCWTNLTGGVWLSFQKPGECKNGSPIGRNGCAWGAVGGLPLKTINRKCIVDHGFYKKCSNATLIQDLGCKFTAAKDVIERAFASEDPERGGCPHVVASSFGHV